MTPERKDYLDKCSNREMLLRAFIADEKLGIKRCKKSLNDSEENFGRSVDLIMIRLGKVRLAAYSHELQRLKGMDRVVVPRNYREWNASITGYLATCKCGRDVSWEHYCPNCGRKFCGRR